jgi:hypothetical protein
MPLPERHTYDDEDGYGCAVCPLPKTHPVHDVTRPPADAVDDPIRTGGAAASYIMGAKALPRSGTFKAELLAIIRGRAQGATDDELEQLTGRSHQSVSAARNSLMRDGHIAAAQHMGQPWRRTTRYANDAQVWVAADPHEGHGAAS